ncbi:MAG TPA: hypothetical protein VGP62_05565 [Bryobacteraceae bacterium]|nr:hypothetical protein [Bryobacteraceae bacterium]
MTTQPQYRKLHGRSGIFVRDSLWMGADHLLSVRRNPFSESYRRFYFADIQAVVVTELPDFLTPICYILLAVIVGVIILGFWQRPAWAAISWLVSLIALSVAARLRKNCACYLQTSISTEMLPSLRRQSDAGKAVTLLKAEIEKAQGSVSAEVLASGAVDARAARVSAPKPAIRHSSGQVHWIAFSLMLVRGAVGATSIKGFTSIPLGVVATVVGTTILLLLILGAIQQRNSDLPLGVRRLVHVTLAFYIASGLVNFAVSIYIAVHLGPRATSQAMILEDPALKIYGLVDVIGFLALGCVGLILMWRHQQAVHTPPPIELGNGG